ncbi:PIN domain-like protein [Mycena maculata]|uniref:PIN domain-like protein n=1 Tax=Mycena maculata TaxID=230809 RepID=A0AAD7J763_9AGAR|nr:PIN domain-like protein [Mycena maculata]
MGANGLWEIIKAVAQIRSLLNLAMIEGLQINNRGLQTFVVGILGIFYLRFSNAIFISFSVQIYACLAARNGDQAGALETLFYQLFNLSRAPVTAVFVFDGPGRPNIKWGVQFTHPSVWLVAQMEQAPGEAEYELWYLDELGAIDAVITEDSDTLVFGAKCIICSLG